MGWRTGGTARQPRAELAALLLALLLLGRSGPVLLFLLALLLFGAGSCGRVGARSRAGHGLEGSGVAGAAGGHGAGKAALVDGERSAQVIGARRERNPVDRRAAAEEGERLGRPPVRRERSQQRGGVADPAGADRAAGACVDVVAAGPRDGAAGIGIVGDDRAPQLEGAPGAWEVQVERNEGVRIARDRALDQPYDRVGLKADDGSGYGGHVGVGVAGDGAVEERQARVARVACDPGAEMGKSVPRSG